MRTQNPLPSRLRGRVIAFLLTAVPLLAGVGWTQAAPKPVGTTVAEPLKSTLVKLFSDTDPYLGTIADRAVPGKAAFSRYRDKSIDDNRLFFDVGNNAVSAAVSPRGAIHRAMIFTGESPRPVGPPGVWRNYHYINFHQDTSFAFKTDGDFVDVAKTGLGQDTSLIQGAFPLTTIQTEDLVIRQLVMAPFHGKDRVRGLLVGLYIEARNHGTRSATLRIPPAGAGFLHEGYIAQKRGEFASVAGLGAGGKAAGTAGYAGYVLLDGLEENRAGDLVHVVLRVGEPVWLPLLLVMGQDEAEYHEIRSRALSLTSESLILNTARHFADHLGSFKVSGKPVPLSPVLRRAIHAQSITPLRDKAGKPVGTAWGSDPSEPNELGHFDFVWTRDSFYNYLSAGLIAPEHCLDGIRFFMTRSVPNYPSLFFSWKGNRNKPPTPPDRPHSLGSAVAPVVLAGAYYSLTGDGQGLRKLETETPNSTERVSLESVIERMLDAIMSTRDEAEPMLFKSNWLSDGEARGKYHTGSNILTRYAFESGARLFREVFNQPEKGKRYLAVAQKMTEDIRKHCTITYEGELMFGEGFQAELVHDGEESDTTIAPFLGFGEADDRAMVRFQKFACSPANPLWYQIPQGLAWGKWGTTFPGFITELASADTEDGLAAKLEKLCGLADVDGQWWWWPMEQNSTDVKRGWVGKTGWATGVFLVRFIHDILGVRWDAPTKALSFKPFVPWTDFEYSGLRVGSLKLDVKYENRGTGVRVDIAHNQAHLNEVTVVLRAPAGTSDCRMVKSSADCLLRKGTPYYGRPTWEIAFRQIPSSPVQVEVEWR